MVIYKYVFGLADNELTVELPENSNVVHFGSDGVGALSIWVLRSVEFFSPKVKRTFRYIGTGREVPQGHKFVATHVTNYGYVWHLFEEVPDAEPASETTGGN